MTRKRLVKQIYMFVYKYTLSCKKHSAVWIVNKRGYNTQKKPLVYLRRNLQKERKKQAKQHSIVSRFCFVIKQRVFDTNRIHNHSSIDKKMWNKKDRKCFLSSLNSFGFRF